MARYLLDTNHLSPLVTLTHPLRAHILERLNQGDRFCIPVPALTEMLYGIQTLPRAQANVAEWARLKNSFVYYELDRDDAEAAALLQVQLRRRGRQLATVDALIATVALRYRLPLLSTDGDFDTIPNLDRRNWL